MFKLLANQLTASYLLGCSVIKSRKRTGGNNHMRQLPSVKFSYKKILLITNPEKQSQCVQIIFLDLVFLTCSRELGKHRKLFKSPIKILLMETLYRESCYTGEECPFHSLYC